LHNSYPWEIKPFFSTMYSQKLSFANSFITMYSIMHTTTLVNNFMQLF